MIVSGSSFFGGVAGANSGLRIAPKQGLEQGPARPRGLSIDDFARRFVDARGSFGGLRTASSTKTRLERSWLIAASTGPLGLDATRTQTSLRSTAEINALDTAYSGGPKSFSGLSTAGASIGGTYDGDQGTDTLTFTVKLGGLVGSTKVQLDVTDGAGQKIQSVDFNNKYSPGSPITLRNGLTVSLSIGLAVPGDSFQVEVYDGVPQAVDPKAAFDSVPGPGFEPGLLVTQGRFTINGRAIDVEADDSILSVLGKINAAGAGVIAQFDSKAEEVVLLADSRGPSGQIQLGADSSGFLDATKLSGAVTVAGKASDLDRAISSVSALSAIASGDFSVNGQTFQIDTATDTLQMVLDRITADQKAGVVATYDSNLDAVELRPKSGAGTVDLEDGTSGLFSALGVSAAGGDETSLTFRSPSEVRAKLRDVAQSLQSLFGADLGAGAETQSQLALMDLKSAVGRSFERQFGVDAGGERFRTGLGIDFVFDDPSGQVVQIDADELSRTLKRDPEALIELFFAGKDGADGLLKALDKAFDRIADRLLAYIGSGDTGLLLDLSA